MHSDSLYDKKKIVAHLLPETLKDESVVDFFSNLLHDETAKKLVDENKIFDRTDQKHALCSVYVQSPDNHPAFAPFVESRIKNECWIDDSSPIISFFSNSELKQADAVFSMVSTEKFSKNGRYEKSFFAALILTALENGNTDKVEEIVDALSSDNGSKLYNLAHNEEACNEALNYAKTPLTSGIDFNITVLALNGITENSNAI